MERLAGLLRTKAADMGQVELARQLGITQSMVSMVLSGKRGIGRKVLVGIIKAWPELEAEAIDYLREM